VEEEVAAEEVAAVLALALEASSFAGAVLD